MSSTICLSIVLFRTLLTCFWYSSPLFLLKTVMSRLLTAMIEFDLWVHLEIAVRSADRSDMLSYIIVYASLLDRFSFRCCCCLRRGSDGDGWSIATSKLQAADTASCSSAAKLFQSAFGSCPRGSEDWGYQIELNIILKLSFGCWVRSREPGPTPPRQVVFTCVARVFD